MRIICLLLLALAPTVHGAAQELPPGPPAAAPEADSAQSSPEEGVGAPADTLDWPQWRGPDRDGKWGGPRWPESLEGEHLVLRWSVDGLGPGYSGPIVADGRVFTVESAEGREIVRALAQSDGEELWRNAWEDAMNVPFFAAKNGSWVRSTPAFDRWETEDGPVGRLYVGGMRDRLRCIDVARGETVFEVDFKQRFGTPEPAFGFASSPLVVGEDLYVQAGAGFCRLDKRTGTVHWRVLVDDDVMEGSAFSSPVLARVAGALQLLVLTRSEMCGLEPISGDVLWRREVRSFRGMNILTPMVHDGAVLTAPYGGRTQLLRVSTDEAGTRVAGEAWNNRLQGYMSSPVILDGHAYLFTRANRFSCVRLADGETTWTSGPSGDEYQSLVAQADRILALSNTGTARLIAADPREFRVLSERSLAEDSWAHVAVVPGALVVRDRGSVAFYDWR